VCQNDSTNWQTFKVAEMVFVYAAQFFADPLKQKNAQNSKIFVVLFDFP